MKVAHSCLPVLRGDCHRQPCAPNEEDVRIWPHSKPQILVFFGLAAVIFVLNVLAALAILSPSEIRTCILVAMVNPVIVITSSLLTTCSTLGLFGAIATKIPRRFSSGPTTVPVRFLTDTFRIGIILTVEYSVGGMMSILLAHLIHPAPRSLEIYQMIAVRTLFTYYTAVFALLWLLQKCCGVTGIAQKQKTEESDTTEEEFVCELRMFLVERVV
jgi:uncharacterized membrane protein